jgi:hypothetical protein
MSRHTKLAKAAPALAKPSPDALLQRAVDHLVLLLAACEATLLAGEASPALARESAGVARSIATLSSEQRQQEKHLQQLVDRMSPSEADDAMERYLRDLPLDRLGRFKSLLDELTNAGSVL